MASRSILSRLPPPSDPIATSNRALKIPPSYFKDGRLKNLASIPPTKVNVTASSLRSGDESFRSYVSATTAQEPAATTALKIKQPNIFLYKETANNNKKSELVSTFEAERKSTSPKAKHEPIHLVTTKMTRPDLLGDTLQDSLTMTNTNLHLPLIPKITPFNSTEFDSQIWSSSYNVEGTKKGGTEHCFHNLSRSQDKLLSSKGRTDDLGDKGDYMGSLIWGGKTVSAASDESVRHDAAVMAGKAVYGTAKGKRQSKNYVAALTLDADRISMGPLAESTIDLKNLDINNGSANQGDIRMPMDEADEDPSFSSVSPIKTFTGYHSESPFALGSGPPSLSLSSKTKDSEIVEHISANLEVVFPDHPSRQKPQLHSSMRRFKAPLDVRRGPVRSTSMGSLVDGPMGDYLKLDAEVDDNEMMTARAAR